MTTAATTSCHLSAWMAAQYSISGFSFQTVILLGAAHDVNGWCYIAASSAETNSHETLIKQHNNMFA